MKTAAFDKFCVIDVETSGINFKTINPAEDQQIVSIAIIVVDYKKMREIDSLLLNIKWNGVSEWSEKAEAIHGLSKMKLDKIGIDEEDAVVKIIEFLLQYFDANDSIVFGGHNVARFDLMFLKTLLYKFDIDLKIAHRSIDTNTLGMIMYDTYTSDDLFEVLGFKPRHQHNALEDARMSLTVIKKSKKIMEKLLNE